MTDSRFANYTYDAKQEVLSFDREFLFRSIVSFLEWKQTVSFKHFKSYLEYTYCSGNDHCTVQFNWICFDQTRKYIFVSVYWIQFTWVPAILWYFPLQLVFSVASDVFNWSKCFKLRKRFKFILSEHDDYTRKQQNVEFYSKQKRSTVHVEKKIIDRESPFLAPPSPHFQLSAAVGIFWYFLVHDRYHWQLHNKVC